ncbi:MAG: zinc ABC transporter ATP-binding protein ZnuC [Pontibacterium sp.]
MMSTPQADALVSLSHVTQSYRKGDVLKDISLTVQEGQITTLIGPNGAGKTTLVKVVLGLLKPTKGLVNRRNDLRIGYMPQKLHIDETFPLTVQRFLGTTGEKDTAKMRVALDEVGADYLLSASVHDLSGGETQRVLLARALLRNPNLLVLDEPVQGVDINGQIELYRLIGRIRDRLGCGVLMVSHDLHLVMSATDEVICLNHHICCSGHPAKVSNDPSFISLFGEQGAEQLALYSHHHNHRHDIHGDVVHECKHD